MKIFKILPCIVLSGCSVIMAGVGHDDPDVSQLKMGNIKPNILATLGSPDNTIQVLSGTEDEYNLEFSDRASLGRAFGWFCLDIATIGIWEFVGTPIEAVHGENRNYYIQ